MSNRMESDHQWTKEMKEVFLSCIVRDDEDVDELAVEDGPYGIVNDEDGSTRIVRLIVREDGQAFVGETVEYYPPDHHLHPFDPPIRIPHRN
jgi:hypothetical protein